MKPPRDRVVAASVDETSLLAQDSLKAKKWAYKVVATKDNTVRISADFSDKLAIPGAFTLVLTGTKTAYGDRTTVRVEGEQKSDVRVRELVTDLELSARKRSNS